MTIKSKSYTKGVRTKPTTSAATEEGEIRNDSSDNKQKVFTEGAEREIVTADQTQTLENKTIDSANNTVTIDADEATVENIEVDNLKAGVLEVDLNNAVDDTNIPSAKSVKDYVAQEVATKDEASEISYDDTSNTKVVGADVQAALDAADTEVQANADAITSTGSAISGHIADAADAHAASAITNTPSGNLAATDVQSALDELQTDVDSRALDSALQDHIVDAVDAHDATTISYDNTTSTLSATEVQGAIDEVEGRLDTVETDAGTAQTDIDNHIADAADAHTASAITNVASGNLAATDVQSALDELQTDVDTRATDADLTAHTGATSGVHGVTGDVVGTTDTQTLTNKTIDGATITAPAQLDTKQDTRANLEVYATTATNGQFVFATDTKEMLQIVDNELVSVGGAGLGGVDVFHVERFEQTEASDTTTGNNASFLGGGVVVGTVENEETTPLKGDRSLKYTQAVGSAMDYVALPVVPVELKERGQLAGLKLSTISTGNDNEIDFIVYDVTNAEVITSMSLKSSSNVLTQELIYNIPETCQNLQYGFQVVVENSGSVLTIDDIELKVNPLSPTEIYASSERKELDSTLINGFGTVATSDIYYYRDGSHLVIEGKFTTVSVGGVSAQIKLPENLAYPSNIASGRSHIGTYFRGATTASSGGPLLIQRDFQNNQYIYFSTADVFTNVSTSALGRQNSNAVAGPGEDISIQARVPIAGWSNTAQGVVVKNRTDSASVENVFSATTDSASTIRNESTDWIEGNPSYSAGVYTYTLKSGLFSAAPSCVASAEDGGTVGCFINTAPTASQVQVYCQNTNTNAALARDHHLVCQRQGTDYITEAEKIVTFPVDNITGNSVRAEGNGGTAITANVTDIDFTETIDSANAWGGGSYTVQKNNSIITIKGSVRLTSSATRDITIFLNGSGYKTLRFGENNSIYDFSFVSSRNEFSQGDIISLRLQTSGGTLSSDNSNHYLNINESYGDRGVFLGAAGFQPTCYVKDVKTSGTAGGSTSATTWNDRVLNTTEGGCGFLSLSSNDFTLSSGTYNIDCVAPVFQSNVTKLRLRQDPTGSPTYPIIGGNGYTGGTTDAQSYAFLKGQLTIGASTVFDIQQYTQSAQATNGLGVDNGLGDEIYTQCEIKKIR